MANVVVVGGANGIGEAVATACAARGDRVFVVDLDEVGAAAAVTKIGGVGSAGCDVADRDAVQRATQAANEALGSIDLVFHGAAISVGTPALKTDFDNARWVVDVNLLGTIYVAELFGRVLAAQPTPSRIVLTGSEHSFGVAHLGLAVYTATKHAVLGFADIFRRELPEHVGVSVLCPGFVNTTMWRSTERRGEAYGGPGQVSPRQGASMAYGMPADEVAAAVLKGIGEGVFLIVTHGHVRRIAQERFEAINEAFDSQAPDVRDDRYEIGKVSERIRAERAAAEERSSPTGDAGA